MARSRRIRRYRKRSGRWASNISEFIESKFNAPASSIFYGTTRLVINPAQNNNSTSQIFTVKNIEASFELEYDSSSGAFIIESLAYYIMYVPQGMTVNDDYNLLHPEYIMAYRFYGSPIADSSGVTPNVPLTNNIILSPVWSLRLSRVLILKGTFGVTPEESAIGDP